MTFCEILHHVRKSFTLQQLGVVVSYMACCVADGSLPFQSQSTCVRLSLNLVECLYQVRHARPRCALLHARGCGWVALRLSYLVELDVGVAGQRSCAFAVQHAFAAHLRLLSQPSACRRPAAARCQAFKRPDSDLAAKKAAQGLLSKILASFVAKLGALAQVNARPLACVLARSLCVLSRRRRASCCCILCCSAAQRSRAGMQAGCSRRALLQLQRSAPALMHLPPAARPRRTSPQSSPPRALRRRSAWPCRGACATPATLTRAWCCICRRVAATAAFVL